MSSYIEHSGMIIGQIKSLEDNKIKVITVFRGDIKEDIITVESIPSKYYGLDTFPKNDDYIVAILTDNNTKIMSTYHWFFKADSDDYKTLRIVGKHYDMTNRYNELINNGDYFTSPYIENITDWEETSTSCKSYIEQAYTKGLITGYLDGSFGGLKTATRAKCATVMLRLIDKSYRVENIEKNYNEYYSGIRLNRDEYLNDKGIMIMD